MSSSPTATERHADSREPSSSTAPMMPASHSSSSSSVQPANLRPVHTRVDSQPLSWIAPEDFDPNAVFDARPPLRPFTYHRSRTSSVAWDRDGSSSRPASLFGINPENNRASTSLSINFVPSKFSDVLAHGGARRRRRLKDMKAPVMARGGGVDAFKTGEARMADDRDDLDPHTTRVNFLDPSDPKSRWTRFKWVLLLFNAVYTMVAIVALVGCMLVWFDRIDKVDVLRIGNRTELIFSTLAASVALFTSVFGWAGVMMNNRSFLAFYTFFLWISFAFLVVPGYLAYRRSSLNLEGKLNFQWSEDFDTADRRRVQNALHCCGYFSPFVEASISSTCYSRSVLPGCKGPYFHFQRRALHAWYTTVFSLAGFYISTIVAALLCSNHVTYRFGKGMMPKAYRLDAASVALIMESYAAQIAEQHGPEVASVVLANSRPGTPAEFGNGKLGPMSYHERAVSPATDGARYSTIGTTTPDTAI
ncbi:hypothetical protein GGX14DRAFT_470755 [Mycena pura]|uniref:Tetraspanin Tsp2 n=1 Tax=Mycena pura TaxID=153505 RepID=A0AAD6V5G3_9AGAR|nr:hypothetical protein GGX14DRAFT_470755 [Mycena pura]